MNKHEFLLELRHELAGFPQADIEERLNFYSEVIDDRMEEGITEEAAVDAIGSVSEIVSQILSDTPLAALVKEKVNPHRALRTWEIVLLILGSPIWLSLLLSAFVILFSVYIVIWSVIISLWSVDLAMACSALGVVISSVVSAAHGNALQALLMLGAAFILAGLSILFFLCCKLASKGLILLTKKILFGIKGIFIRKGDVK